MNLESLNITKNIETTKLEGVRLESGSSVLVEKEKTDQHRFDAIRNTTNYIQGSGLLVNFSNFIIGFIRPAISLYLLWFLLIIYKTDISTNSELLPSFLEHFLAFVETMTSFWFYQRSTQKDFMFGRGVR